MSEFVFPLAAIALTFLVMIPLLTLASRWVLHLRRSRETVWAHFGSEGTFALLLAPSAIPLLWLVSSSVHQSEPWRALEACVIDHINDENCLDALALSSGLALGLLLLTVLRARRETPRFHGTPLGHDHWLQRRLHRLANSSDVLTGLRITVLADASEPVFTTGWFKTECFMDARFVETSDDRMLSAALLHESAHMRSFDNLRAFLIRLALLVNPAGKWLRSDFARWQQAREADCDSHAVHQGGEALALAQSIIQAAKFRAVDTCPRGALALCGPNMTALRLRVALLFEGPPEPQTTRGHLILSAAVVVAVVLPHIEPTAFLDHFHFTVERLVHSHSST